MMQRPLSVALERVRYKLMRAYRALADEGAITPEQFAEVARLLERIEDVPPDEVRNALASLGTPGTCGRGVNRELEAA